MVPAPVELADQSEQPEQLVHGVKGLSTAQVGTVIDTGPATITQILFTTSPTGYEVPEFDPGTGLPKKAYFCLIDAGPPSRVLFSYNGHINGGHSPHATNKMSAYNMSFFGNLILQSCPAGAVFSLTTA